MYGLRFRLAGADDVDGVALGVNQLVVHTSGTGDFSKVTWRLNGPDAANVTGVYNSAAGTITFSSLALSVANGGSETYTINAYFNNTLKSWNKDEKNLKAKADKNWSTLIK